MTRRLAEELIGVPYVSVPSIERRLHVTRSSASNAIRNLVKEHVLVPVGDGNTRPVTYVAPAVLNAVH
ncbi:hypothetical protein [uncultured Bifidobacterium sp.]|uniref:hypothetical protein n=1 Tax=uncultured Bifidobacterium sp. TaxID=165187 RepID=UPI0025875D6D|nr:hypothetical protein [uncultured Bifidobacterium sp.]